MLFFCNVMKFKVQEMEVIVPYSGGKIFEMRVSFLSENLLYGVLDLIRRKLSP